MNRKLMRMLIVVAYILLPVLIAAVSLRNRNFLSAGPPFGDRVLYGFDGSHHASSRDLSSTLQSG